MKTKLTLLIVVSIFLVQCKSKTSKTVLIPKQANKFVEVYQPDGDVFFGPDTKVLKEGKFYERWIPNDHTFVKAEDGKWHIFGITHPYTDPKLGSIHQGEFASFHAISSVTNFKETLSVDHYSDLPKILTPKERPGEITANHAPYIIKKDNLYYMVYGHSPMRLATSPDLNNWTPKGTFFEEEEGARDPNLILHDGTYYMTYCSEKCVRMRTSKDLLNWSEAKTILVTNEFDPESPSVIFHNDTFYLFVCAWEKGSWDRIELLGAYTHKAHVFASDDLMDFGTDQEKQITILNAHAPEIFQGEDKQWYISSVMYPGYGVSVDKLFWE
ncbi:family 43 glycosylhydrolase [Polaribacter sp. Q13]|uniref:family 43 glycosylhydrolase n=1 Tax=Polaribacter sp. Q13 TaxID=2806551 RepID=UPI00193B4EC8|nr:family 43 glycosylhydrolase [Polaribacter sp. Q13]QVY65984.1 family 43 glycosylhydrolase [Polaribacter sp. Q13]